MWERAIRGTIEDMDNTNLEKSPRKQLRRTREGRILAGVCSGAADYLGVDANILRLGLAVFSLLGGSGIALYVVAWVLMPEEGQDKSIAQDVIDKNRDNPRVQNAMTKTKETFSSLSKR
jgi:phage shock protein C